ncbi:MAG TPA: PEGA domain-containing protein [Vicinamibacterales bacterium]
MNAHNLLSASALLVALVLLPATADAQRRGRHHGGRTDGRSVVIVAQPGAVRQTVVKPVVVGPAVVVRQPIIGGWGPSGSFGRIGFGSIPVRRGFGTLPVRTGFETAPIHTGFDVQTHLAPRPVTIGRGHAFRSKGGRAFRTRHVVGGSIVVGYPVPYAYAYPPPYGFTTSSAGYYVPPLERRSGAHSGIGVSAGPSTYFMDLADAGGLMFEVSPATAGVFVDGTYVGTVQDFSTASEPLMVVPGSHRIELRAPGYRTSTLDVTIAAGQVIPYEGEMERLQRY